MSTLNKILVVNDSLEGLEVALAKAALIEHYSGAEVEIAEVIWDHIEDEPIPDPDKANLIEAFVASERKALREMVEPYRDRIAWHEERVLWQKRPSDAIEDEVARTGIDLVIKPVGTHHGIADFLVTPLDWKILRTLECPVLISKDSSWATGGSILAAVDVGDEEHEALSIAVLYQAVTMSRLLDAKLHIVTAYPDLGPPEDYFEAANEYEAISNELAQEREQTLRGLLGATEVEGIHVRPGKPVDVIRETADQIAPTLTVIGTSARKGLSKLILGNTAEDVLNQLPGDILTVHAA